MSREQFNYKLETYTILFKGFKKSLIPRNSLKSSKESLKRIPAKDASNQVFDTFQNKTSGLNNLGKFFFQFQAKNRFFYKLQQNQNNVNKILSVYPNIMFTLIVSKKC